jgi:uncharacterized protein YndB with AHSA1/START domain
MTAHPPDLAISRVFDAPRALVYRAFTDPEHLAAWWGPTGSVRPLDEMTFDVRPGGFQRYVQVTPDDPTIRVVVHIDLTDVAEDRVLEGVMRVGGDLPGGFEPFETRFRFELHDEPDGRTRLEVRQWLPPHVTGATEEGWGQSFAALDAHLATMTAPRRTPR